MAIASLACAAALALLPADAAAQRKGGCISDAEIEAELGDAIRAGALMLDASRIDDGRPVCGGGTVTRRIQQIRERAFPKERAERIERRDRARAEGIRNSREEEEGRDRERELVRLQQLARQAEARRDAALAEAQAAGARADASEAELRGARARRALAALPPGMPARAAVLVENNATLDDQLDAVLTSDSSHWLVNGYRPRSVFGARLLSMDSARQNYEIYGRFYYTSGREGWLRVQYAGGEFICVIFHNQSNNCRDIGDPLSHQNLRSALGELFWTALPLVPRMAGWQ